MRDTGKDAGGGGEAEKLSLQTAWAMAVGGMIGGGIFSVLGVVVEQAGRSLALRRSATRAGA